MDRQEALLKGQVQEQLAVVNALDDQAAEYPAAVSRLAEVTDALITYGAQLPQLRQEAEARRRRKRFAVAGAMQMVCAVTGGLFAGFGPTSLGWLILLVPVLLIGAGWATAAPTNANATASVALCTVAALVVLLMTFHVISGFWTVAVFLIWGAALAAAEAGAGK